MEELEMMEKKQKQEIIDAIRENSIYDFIFSNQFRMHSDIIRELLLECLAVIQEEQNNKKLIENLKEYKNWEVK